MKIRISREEQYPVYCALKDNDENRELPLRELSLEEWADYERVMRECDAWQIKLRQLLATKTAKED